MKLEGKSKKVINLRIILVLSIMLSMLLTISFVVNSQNYEAELAYQTATAYQVKVNYQTQISIFNSIWKVIDRDYLYRETQQKELLLLKNAYENRLNSNGSMTIFYQLMYEMVNNLGDKHSSFLPPASGLGDICLPAGYLYGSGAYLVPIPADHLVKVIDVLPNSPADRAGLKEYDNIIEIDGQSALDVNNQMRCIRVKQNAELSIQRPTDGTRQKITLQPLDTSLPYPVFWVTFDAKGGGKVGYIRLLGFDQQTPEGFRSALLEVMSLPNLLGLIIDVRVNTGGTNEHLQSVLSFFITGNQGHYKGQTKYFPAIPFDIPPLHDLNGSSSIPLVVLVGSETKSAGELFAGMLQNSKRAHIIGEKTPGNVEGILFYRLADKSTLSLSVYKFISNNPDIDWKKTGVVPDQIVPIDWKHFVTFNDPVIKAGIAYFEQMSKD